MCKCKTAFTLLYENEELLAAVPGRHVFFSFGGMFANPIFWALACQKTVITGRRALRRESGLGFLSINSPFSLWIGTN